MHFRFPQILRRLPLLLVLAVPATAPSNAAVPSEEAESLFVRRVAPLIQQKCLPCHGRNEKDLSGSLDLRSRASALKGGDSETPALVPGSPERSPIYLAVTRKSDQWEAMPPKEATKLTAEQVEAIKRWIAQGAPWPSEARAKQITQAYGDKWSAEDGVTVPTSGGLSPAWTNRRYKPEGLWAYQPIKKPAVRFPGAKAIDELIEKRMPAGLASAPPADARTFIRRATFDLTGLPPTPEEITAFEADWRHDALAATARLVDRLLASPHYGERMAQHWLDVVRYADSSGLANDFARGNAWRYRDYVVRAFNADKPYDQFVRQQLAGDEIDPDDPEQVIATGFLRMGPWELTAMEVPKVARQRFLDDVTNSVGETFLAQSLQCARCHDHKFDPVPTRDYYSLQAVFATTQLAERKSAFLPAENVRGFEERAYLEQSRNDYHATLRLLDAKSLRGTAAWFAKSKRDPALWQAAVQQAEQHRANEVFQAAREILLKKGVPEGQFPPRMLDWSPEDIGMDRIARKGLERLAWELDRYEPVTLAVYDGRTPQVSSVLRPVRLPADRLTRGELEQTCILPGGDPFGKGPAVKPGVLSVLAAVPSAPIPESIEGRRKSLADWIASPANPLTARAIVNRMWMWHFGEPIAGNPNNFGSTGKRPTHPELLDWLAATFVEQGWSFKTMHRLIMTSEAYRRSTWYPDRKLLVEKDPVGSSYAVFKPRRLSAEEICDAMLAATGELNLTLGGIPNRPEINLEAALQPRQVMGTFAAAWTANPLPQQRHRRSLYALKLRGLRDPALEVFNAPACDFSCERREASTVTPQVFSLFNSQASCARALALANRVHKEAHNDADAIGRCFLLVYGRSPRADELSACLSHWRSMQSVQAKVSFAAAKLPLKVRREAVEENTGEIFSFREKLYGYDAFVPDLQPRDVDLRTRALSDVCLALFNSNEFVYVY